MKVKACQISIVITITEKINLTYNMVKYPILDVEMAISNQDQQLISLLQNNGRMPVAQIARSMSVSRTAAKSRLDKLQRNGVITGFSVQLGESYLQGRVQAMVMIKAPALKRELIEQELMKLTQLESLYSISGAFDLMALVSAQTIGALDSIIDHIGQFRGVEDTMSSVILSSKVSK